MKDLEKENQFYNKPFKFSYSSINKLLFSPKLFYKDYILLDREERIDKHLVEGKLLHCLLLEPDKLEKKFKIVPDKTPSDNVRKVLHRLFDAAGANQDLLEDTPAWNSVILQVLVNQNLYQSLKKDEARLAKIKTAENNVYWNFISNPLVDVVDSATVEKCKSKIDILMQNNTARLMYHTINNKSDFELDNVDVYVEKFLDCELDNYDFGLKGFIDYYEIDHENKLIKVYDVKTSGKSISDFKDSVDYYNYWLQAMVYVKLIGENHKDVRTGYDVDFRFVVIDTYNQVYDFQVSNETWIKWTDDYLLTLDIVNHHYKNKSFDIPYKFMIDEIKL